jgi:uncharacterized membrane protein
MQAIYNAIVGFGSSIYNSLMFLAKLSNQLEKIVWFVVVATITMGVKFLDFLFDQGLNLLDKVADLLVLVSNGGLGQQGSTVPDMLTFGNTVWPLEETIGIAGILTSFWLVASHIRIVKSWIPTES